MRTGVPGTEGHNVSPNFPLFPGSTITLRGTPELAGAINKWMETRRGRGGWTTAWDTSVWARLERGEKVEQWLRALMRNSLADNLHNRGSNQSDANFGLTAAIAEALLQSHAGEISLLPALPPSWSTGAISGLRARGGFEVAMRWNDGKLQSATIRNAAPATFKVRYGGKTADVLDQGWPDSAIEPGLDVGKLIAEIRARQSRVAEKEILELLHRGKRLSFRNASYLGFPARRA